jgi:hypothetical protein
VAAGLLRLAAALEQLDDAGRDEATRSVASSLDGHQGDLTQQVLGLRDWLEDLFELVLAERSRREKQALHDFYTRIDRPAAAEEGPKRRRSRRHRGSGKRAVSPDIIEQLNIRELKARAEQVAHAQAQGDDLCPISEQLGHHFGDWVEDNLRLDWLQVCDYLEYAAQCAESARRGHPPTPEEAWDWWESILFNICEDSSPALDALHRIWKRAGRKQRQAFRHETWESARQKERTQFVDEEGLVALPPDLLQVLDQQAKAHGRSRSAEVVELLRQTCQTSNN